MLTFSIWVSSIILSSAYFYNQWFCLQKLGGRIWCGKRQTISLSHNHDICSNKDRIFFHLFVIEADRSNFFSRYIGLVFGSLFQGIERSSSSSIIPIDSIPFFFMCIFLQPFWFKNTTYRDFKHKLVTQFESRDTGCKS